MVSPEEVPDPHLAISLQVIQECRLEELDRLLETCLLQIWYKEKRVIKMSSGPIKIFNFVLLRERISSWCEVLGFVCAHRRCQSIKIAPWAI